MNTVVEKTAKTIDDAINAALLELGAERDEVEIEILETPKSGFLGIGSALAKVRVTARSDVSSKVQAFLSEIFEKMNVSVDIDIEKTESELNVELKSKEMGRVIGRRGETLDAIQYLTSVIVNRDAGENYLKVVLDTAGYREKREQTLERLANKLASKVLRYRKSVTLEPMNPYERRVIHSALQNVEGVTTHSTGQEPYRRVVIALDKGTQRRNKEGN